MDSLLVKIFATALTFSQVTVGPETIKTEFDPVQDQHEVVSLLRAGCAHMRKAFDIEDINVDDLIATAMDDPEAVTGGLPQFRGMNLGDLHTAYQQFCKNETVENSPVDIANVIEFYNRAVANLPDHTRLRGMRLPGASVAARRQGREIRGGVRAGPAARLGAARRDSRRMSAGRVHRGRGQALPSAPRHRRARADPRLHRQPDPVRPAAGRLDHHPAAGEEPAGRRRPLLRAQDARDDRRRPRRAAALQGRDPRALSQLGVPRPRLLGHRAGGARLFREARQRAHAGGGRAAGGADQGAEFLQSRPPSAAGARPLRLRARSACARTT